MADDEGASAACATPRRGLEGRRDRRRSARSARGARRERLTVYLTPGERQELALRSRVTGESMAKLLVDAALHPIGVPGGGPAADQGAARELQASLQDYRLQLVGIARNINQIARHANTVCEVPADFGAVVDRVGRVCDEIDELLAVAR